MTDLPTLSQSKASRWNTCRASYHYKYVRDLKRRRVARPLTFGSAVHKVIEDTVQGVATPKLRASLDKWATDHLSEHKYFTAELDMFQEAVDDAWLIMREYATFWPNNHLKYLKVEGRFAEHELRFKPSQEDFIITGKIDAYAKSRNGLKWLVEHKSGRTLLSDEDRWRSIQSAVYLTVGRELGHPEVDGMVWDMVRSKEPTKPYLLQNGTFSLKMIDSLPSVIIETIKAAGQDPNDYPTLLATVAKNSNQWFQRVFQPVTENVRTFLFGQFIQTGRDILDNAHKNKQMTIGKHCSWCDYEPICRALMSNNDVDYVIEKEFTSGTITPNVKAKTKGGVKVKKPVQRGVLRRQQSTDKKGR